MVLGYKILFSLVIGILSGVFYRMGGSDRYNKNWRDLGLPFLMLTYVVLVNWNWWIILSFFLMFGALTTYWKKKGTDATFLNYWLHGLGISLAVAPYSLVTGHLSHFVARIIVLPLLMAFWSIIEDNAVREEFGRGFLIGFTFLLL
jgi:hypothetical protein